MLGRRGPEQFEFFAGSLRDLISDEHILARVDRVLDLPWPHDEVAELYCPDNGWPGIDSEAALYLILAGFLPGIVHDRRLMCETKHSLAIGWFAGVGLTEGMPRHSSLTMVQQRQVPRASAESAPALSRPAARLGPPSARWSMSTRPRRSPAPQST